MMNGLKKSDEVIGAMKADSNGGSPPAERLEPRTRAKPSSRDGNTCCTQRRTSVLNSIMRVHGAAVTKKEEKLTCLLHPVILRHLTVG